MADVRRLIEINIDSTKAKSGAQQVSTSVDRMGRELTKADRQLDSIQRSADKAGGALGTLKRAFVGLAGGISALLIMRRVTGDIGSFEEGLVGLGKVANLEGQALDALGDSIDRMGRKLPGTTRELLDTASAAARLGVQGADDIEKFTEVIAKFTAASGGAIAPEESATQFARILNVTREGTGEVENLAGAIALLGDSFAASEPEILHHTTGVAQATAAFEIGATKASAFATTLAALGVRAELGGSSLGRTFRAMDRAVRDGGEALDQLQRMTGATVGELERLRKEDPSTLVLQFLEGLRQFMEVGGDSTRLLEEFGLQGEEVLKVIPTLAKSTEDLAGAIELVSDEQRNANKLTEETDRGLKILNARFEEFGDTVTSASTSVGSLFANELKWALDFMSRFVVQTAGMEESTGRLDNALKLVGRTTLIVGGTFAWVIGLGTAGALLKTAAASQALSGTLTAVLLPALAGTASALGIVGAALGAIATGLTIGKTIYDEFAIVRRAAAGLVRDLTTAWSHIQAGWETMVLALREAWVDGVGFITRWLGDLVIEVGSATQLIENLARFAGRNINLGGGQITGAGEAIRNLAGPENQVDFEGERAMIQARRDRSIAMAKAVLERTLADIDSGAPPITLRDSVESLWRDLGRKSGESFSEGLAEQVEGGAQRIIEGATNAGNATSQALSQVTADTDALTNSLNDTENAADKTTSSLLNYARQLQHEFALINRTSEERERAIELLRIEDDLVGMTTAEIKELNKVLSEEVPSLADRIGGDPAKLAEAEAALKLIENRLVSLKEKAEFESFADQAGDAFGDLATDVAFEFENARDIIKGFFEEISRMVFQQLVARQIAGAVTGFVSGSPGMFGGPTQAGAKGLIVGSDSRVTPFANGGVIDRPTVFPLRGGTGLMGEAGPEAIMPLGRDDQGRLGVRGGGGTNVNVRMVVNTPDADSFKRSSGQLSRRINSNVRIGGMR